MYLRFQVSFPQGEVKKGQLRVAAGNCTEPHLKFPSPRKRQRREPNPTQLSICGVSGIAGRGWAFSGGTKRQKEVVSHIQPAPKMADVGSSTVKHHHSLRDLEKRPLEDWCVKSECDDNLGGCS